MDTKRLKELAERARKACDWLGRVGEEPRPEFAIEQLSDVLVELLTMMAAERPDPKHATK